MRLTNPRRTLPMILHTTPAPPSSFWRAFGLVAVVAAFLAYAVPGVIRASLKEQRLHTQEINR